MEKMNIRFELNETQEKERKELYNKVVLHPKIKEFIDDNRLNPDFVLSHIASISAYYDEIVECEHCKGLNHCQKVNHGQYLGLRYDRYIQKVVTKCDYTKELESQMSHRKNFIQCDFSEECNKIDFASLDVVKESVEYKKLVIDLIKWSKNKDVKGYYLFGKVGVGKTYLAACLANQLAKENCKVAFIHVPTLSSTVKTIMQDGDELEKLIYQLKHVALLVLDDIGAESITRWYRDDILLPILNYRYDAKLSTFFTSNYSPSELLVQYMYANKQEKEELPAQRILSRIEAMAESREIVGRNRRNNA